MNKQQMAFFLSEQSKMSEKEVESRINDMAKRLRYAAQEIEAVANDNDHTIASKVIKTTNVINWMFPNLNTDALIASLQQHTFSQGFLKALSENADKK